MKKPIIKLFDKLILFLILGSSAALYTSCEYGAPVPEYGVMPMYGPPTEGQSIIIEEEANQDIPIINEADLQD
ncbi:MAG: hypothetical protein FWD09_04780 [Lentimicrobiaceae bacterium]|nr:hypothetical protein [Lentimicrobiaceae bacterium]